MEIQTYLAILWRRKWIIVATTLVMVIGTAIVNFLTTPTFISSATLRVATVGANAIGGGRPDIEYTLRLMNTYANIVNSRSTRQELTQRLNLSERPTLSVNIVPGTELMKVEAEATDAEEARAVAAAAAEIVVRSSQEQYRGGGLSTLDILDAQIAQSEEELATARANYDRLLKEAPVDSPALEAAAKSIDLKENSYAGLLQQRENVRIQAAVLANSVYIVDPAEVATTPAKPRTDVNLVLGTLVGLIIGIVLAFLFDSFDSTLHTAGQIQSMTRLPTVGRIPAVIGHSPVIGLNGALNGFQPHLEAYRRLRVNVLSAGDPQPPQAILVTSADEGEGKSTVVANLAIAMAKSGRSVVLVDCDLHQPAQHKIFNLKNEFGLTHVLTKQVSVAGVLQKGRMPNLSLITSGPALPNPAQSPELMRITPSALADRFEQGTELLGSPEMNHLLDQLRNEYDVVLLDTPALLSVTDAAVLAPLVDIVMLVVAPERSHRDSVRSVLELLDGVKVKSIGVVINRDRQQIKSYAYHAN